MKNAGVIFYIGLSLVLFYFISLGVYNCGEYEGQKTQYNFYKSFGDTEEHPYTALHQYSGGLFNPFCLAVLRLDF